jgi:uncharacterized protein YifE (UPF0438 family)
MDMHELIKHMERAEKIWPDERSWTIQVLAGYLHISSCDLLPLFQQVNQALQSERDQVFSEDLRLLKAHCERQLAQMTQERVEDKRRNQIRARKMIHSMIPKISEMIAGRDYTRALNSYIYLLEESGEYALPEEKAQWYEEMGRLCLKNRRHPNEAARYFRLAVSALSLLEDRDGIQDLLDTYDEEFCGDTARCSWYSVIQIGRESLSKLDYIMT